MKKIIIFFIGLLLIGCSARDIREDSLKKPEFEFQKSYVLRQVPGDFIAYFNVWKNLPIDYTYFESLEDIRSAKYYTARQRITIIGNNYLIKDRVNKKDYELIQDLNVDNPEHLNIYSILHDGKVIGTINQVDKDMDYYYEYDQFDDKKYIIEGEIKQFGINIHSFVFTIKHKDDTLGVIYKENNYVKNHYDITINREYKNIEDHIFICFSLMIDSVLREKGYKYKNW